MRTSLSVTYLDTHLHSHPALENLAKAHKIAVFASSLSGYFTNGYAITNTCNGEY